MNKVNVEQQQTLEQIRGVVDLLVQDRSVTARLDGQVHDVFPVAVSPGEGEGLRDWVVREGAIKTIEVGFGYGISALHICEGLVTLGHEEAKHIVLDPNQVSRFSNCGLQALEDAGVGHMVEHISERSEIVLPQFVKEERCFDLGFVDGNHHFDHVFVDLFFMGRLVKSGGVIILDDYDVAGIKSAVSFWVKNAKWEIVDTFGEGHSVVLRTSKEAHNWHFRDFIAF